MSHFWKQLHAVGGTDLCAKLFGEWHAVGGQVF